MHNETSLGREGGEAMPSASLTMTTFIQRISLDQRGQNYSLSFDGETIIDKTRIRIRFIEGADCSAAA